MIPTQTLSLSSEQLTDVLSGRLNRGIEGVTDLMERGLVEDNIMLLGDTARAVVDQVPLYGDHIEVGIERRYISSLVASVFKQYMGAEDPYHSFTFEIAGVPVKVKVIQRVYGFFKNKSAVNYDYRWFLVPNPFEKYWKARFIIK